MVRIKPVKVLNPPSTGVFVFGSNLAGRHGKGAALHALKYYGAESCVAIGHIGQCYAIPTKDQVLRPLSLQQIEHFILGFKAYAKKNQEIVFNVTQIGCGLAGFKPQQIAPMFHDAPSNCHFDRAWAEHLPKEASFWDGPL